MFDLGFLLIVRDKCMEWVYETNEDNSARFALGQIFDKNGKTLLCFGINPSTACPTSLDNTIRKLISISKNNGYDNWIMLNVYPQRATNPDDIHKKCDEQLMAQNMQHIRDVVEKYAESDILLAYGNLISKRKFLKTCLNNILFELAKNYNKTIKVIKLTKEGNPVHPLYQSNLAKLCDFCIKNEND